ncbi:ABC transporter permease [Actinopolymorpha alba]|uniref:ABC transporter permease n=1 Tax=Actinopolymorpha alba TaxID=533267 RepID=UPI0003657BC0|nr:ABC transporter permease [Actinopolymorpha alba]
MTQIVDAGSADLKAPPPPEGKDAGAFKTFVRAMMRSRTGFIGFLVFAGMVLLCLIGPLFMPDTLPTDTSKIYGPASLGHPFGFDSEGRDVFVQLINGGRAVILVGFLAAVISTVIAVVFGALAAYLGGRVDSIIVAATDIVLTVPSIILLAVLAAFYRVGSAWSLAVILGVLGWPGLLRAVRAQVFSLKQREYIEAARLLDLGTGRIVIREILPNMASFILMNFVIGMTNAIYAMAGLYLLGLAPMQGDNWGIMINFAWTRGAIFFQGSLGYILAPVLAICIVQLSLVTMARSFEEILNPRLRHN